MVYTLTMQLLREQFINLFIKEYTKDGIYKGFAGVKNLIFTASEKLADKITKNSLAKTSIGEKIGLQSLKGRAILSLSITAVILFGADLRRSLSGRISTKQLIKNSAVGASGIGGATATFISKKTLDSFIEDDGIAMFQVVKEEFDQVENETIYSDEIDKYVCF